MQKTKTFRAYIATDANSTKNYTQNLSTFSSWIIILPVVWIILGIWGQKKDFTSPQVKRSIKVISMISNRVHKQSNNTEDQVFALYLNHKNFQLYQKSRTMADHCQPCWTPSTKRIKIPGIDPNFLEIQFI